MVRVASVFLGMPVGGAEDLALGLARSLAPRGIETHFVCLRSLDVVGEEIASQNLPVTLLPVAASKRFSPAGIRRLADWLKENRIDIVHSHTYHAHTYAIPAASRAGIPAILHHHKTFEKMKWHRWWTMRSLTRKASRVLALSEQTAADLAASFRLPASQVLALPNAVNEDIFHPVSPEEKAATRRELGIAEDAFVFLTVASLQDVKNHNLILDAVALEGAAHASSLHNELFLFLGEGPRRGELTGRINTMGAESRFRLPGRKRPVAPWLQCADAFLLPSTWEGQSLALLQAIRCGLPVLASRIEGNTAILGNSHPGLFEIENPARLYSLIQECLTADNWRAQTLQYQQSLRLPEWKTLVERMEKLLRSLNAAVDSRGAIAPTNQ